jgi:signal peptidase I
MEPTLDVGQRVLVNRFLYHFKDPQIGDIVVFHPPQGANGGGGECGDPRTGAGGSSGAE